MDNIFNKLRAEKNYYSDIENKISECILNDPEGFINYSIGALAEELGVSQGSINNFSKKLIGSGFASLKLRIAQQLSSFDRRSFESISETDNAKSALIKTAEQVRLAFENTCHLNSDDSIERATQLILNAKKIEIYGIFLSGVVAQNLRFQLMQLGISADHVSDVLLSQVSASMLDSSSVVIAVSVSGKTKDVIDAVMTAKQNNVPIIALTSNANSHLAKISDVVLLASSSGTNISNSAYEMQFCQLLIADAVCSYIRHKIDKDGSKNYFKVKEIISSHSIEG